MSKYQEEEEEIPLKLSGLLLSVIDLQHEQIPHLHFSQTVNLLAAAVMQNLLPIKTKEEEF